MMMFQLPLRRLGLSLAFGCLAAFAARPAAAQTAPSSSLTFQQILPRQTIYDYAANPCPEKYIPDGPARGFRRADGKFALEAEELDNWQLVGDSPLSLRVSCPSILSSSNYGLLNRGMTGIQATYTEDGQTIYGFAGQDLTALDEAIGCQDQGVANCWQNDIEAVTSTDMGNSFSFTSAGNGDVAALTHTLATNQSSPEGYFTSSNIVKRNGYYFMTVFVEDTYAQQARTCLLRTANLADPTSWRGYDGSGFNAVLQPAGAGPSPIPCAAIGTNSLYDTTTSLSFIPSKNIYVAVFQTQLQLTGDAAPVPGAYYSTSADLLHWSATQRLMELPRIPGVDSLTEVDEYPVLLDPFSRTRNFETLDSSTPVLVFTVEHLDNGSGTMDRDLDAVPLVMH